MRSSRFPLALALLLERGGVAPLVAVALVSAAILAKAPAARAEVVERILAVVDGTPVFLSEARLFARVRGEALPAALDGLIDERLMYREASRLPQAAVTPEEEEKALASLLSRAPAATPAEEVDLRRLARRQTAILKYVDFRFRPQVRAADAAAARRDLDQRVEAWVKELRQEAQVRYNPEPPPS